MFAGRDRFDILYRDNIQDKKKWLFGCVKTYPVTPDFLKLLKVLGYQMYLNTDYPLKQIIQFSFSSNL